MSSVNIRKLIGDRLRQWRKMQSLTQVDVEEKTKIPQPTLSSWERGESTPSGEDLFNLQSNFPAIDIAWVISGARHKKMVDEGEAVAVDQVREEMAEWNRGLAGRMTLGRREQKMVDDLLGVIESKNAEAIMMAEASLKAARMLADPAARHRVEGKKGREK